MSCSAFSSRTGSSTKNGSNGSITLHEPHRIVQIEPLVQIDAPIAFGSDGFAHRPAVGLDLLDQ
jgi:hypothetical protein